MSDETKSNTLDNLETRIDDLADELKKIARTIKKYESEMYGDSLPSEDIELYKQELEKLFEQEQKLFGELYEKIMMFLRRSKGQGISPNDSGEMEK